jgi:hypothetical protein
LPRRIGPRKRLDEFFGDHANAIGIEEKSYVWRYRSPQHWLEMWREIYGPLQKAFEVLGDDAKDQLSIDILALIDRFNIADDGTMVVPASYLEVVVVKKDDN